jgi:hypothetical protein
VELDLDAWLPDPQVRTRHRRSARADADRLWKAAETVQVCDAPRIGRVVRWRVPGTPGDLPFRELFRRYPFTVLDEGERCSISGLCGRVWSFQRDYPELAGSDEFLGWDEPGTVRVLFGHWVEEADGGSALVSEARVKPVDGTAGRRLRTLWKLIGPFERLVGAEAIATAARAAGG